MYHFNSPASNLQKNHFVWMSLERPPAPETQAKKQSTAETFRLPPVSPTDTNTAEEKLKKEDNQEMSEITKLVEREKAELPSEFADKNTHEIKALSLDDENAEKLCQTCFWKWDGTKTKWQPAQPGTMQKNDEITFYAPNESTEQGVGCRVLQMPENLKLISNNGSEIIFVNHTPIDPNTGHYRAVLSNQDEIFIVVETTEKDSARITELKNSSNYKMLQRRNAFTLLADNVSDKPTQEDISTKLDSLKNKFRNNPVLLKALNEIDDIDQITRDLQRLTLQSTEASPSFRNNNPGNLKYIGQAGSIGADKKGFARFISLEAGTTAHKQQITIDANRNFTVLEFTQKYLGMTPGGTELRTTEGDAPAYAETICRATNSKPNEKLADVIAKSGIDSIQKAMQIHEGWRGPDNLKI